MSAYIEYPEAVVLANARVKASWPGSLQRVHASIDAYRSLAEHLCFTGDDRALGALETFAERVQVSVTLAVTWLALAQTTAHTEAMRRLREDHAREIATLRDVNRDQYVILERLSVPKLADSQSTTPRPWWKMW